MVQTAQTVIYSQLPRADFLLELLNDLDNRGANITRLEWQEHPGQQGVYYCCVAYSAEQ